MKLTKQQHNKESKYYIYVLSRQLLNIAIYGRRMTTFSITSIINPTNYILQLQISTKKKVFAKTMNQGNCSHLSRRTEERLLGTDGCQTKTQAADVLRRYILHSLISLQIHGFSLWKVDYPPNQ